MAIVYTSELSGVGEEDLRGFFVSWPNPPDAGTLLRVLRGSQHAVVAKVIPRPHDRYAALPVTSGSAVTLLACLSALFRPMHRSP